MTKWSEAETFQFVEFYCEKECLWKKSSVNYRNKNMRKAAEEDIVRRMGKEGFGVTECKQKIKIIRTMYNQEVLKIKNLKKSGGKLEDIYVPTIKWFNVMDKITDNHTPDNEGESMETTIGALNQSEELQGEEDHEVQEVDDPSARPQHTPEQSLTRRTSSGAEARPTKKARLQRLTEAVKEVRQVQESLANTDSLDENEAFGKFVTARLNKLPPAAAIMAQCDIQKILQQYRLASLNDKSSVNLVSGCSSQSSPTYNFSRESSPGSTTHEHAHISQFQLYETNKDIADLYTTTPRDAHLTDLVSEAWKLSNE